MEKLTKCATCGTEILFIRMASGKWMPCDPRPVEYQPDQAGKQLLIAPNGVTVKGKAEGEGKGSGFFGYRSHFASCPGAAYHRKKGGKNAG